MGFALLLPPGMLLLFALVDEVVRAPVAIPGGPNPGPTPATLLFPPPPLPPAPLTGAGRCEVLATVWWRPTSPTVGDDGLLAPLLTLLLAPDGLPYPDDCTPLLLLLPTVAPPVRAPPPTR